MSRCIPNATKSFWNKKPNAHQWKILICMTPCVALLSSLLIWPLPSAFASTNATPLPIQSGTRITRATGSRLLWRYLIGNVVDSTTEVAGGVAYVGSDQGLYALNANNGTLLWHYPLSNYIVSEPAVVNGVVYFGDGNGIFYALNASNGTLVRGAYLLFHAHET